MTLNDLLRTRYVRGARGVDECDCYGLVRLARVHLFGRPWLPAYGQIDSMDKRGLTQAAATFAGDHAMSECRPRPGAIAAAYSARLCMHVGIVVEVDRRPWILETDEPTGPCLTPLHQFEARYTRVVFYDDPNLS